MLEVDEQQEVVIFDIGKRNYALPAESVREVLPLMEPTPVPEWPEYALGLIEVRGTLIPLVDVAPALGLEPSPISAEQRVVTVAAKNTLWGILVDSVEGVRRTDIRPLSSVRTPQVLKLSNLCLGLVSNSGSQTILLNPELLIKSLKVPERDLSRDAAAH
jgi:chemotaxis signal transduction protein